MLRTNFLFDSQKEILDGILSLKKKSDQSQIEMTKECEKILEKAESIQKEKLRSRLSYQHSEDEDPEEVLKNCLANLEDY